MNIFKFSYLMLVVTGFLTGASCVATVKDQPSSLESIRINEWRVPDSPQAGRSATVALEVEGAENTELFLCISHNGQLLWGELLPYFGKRAFWAQRPLWVQSSVFMDPDWPDGNYDVSVSSIDGQRIAGVTRQVIRRNGENAAESSNESDAFGAQEVLITGWNVPTKMEYGKTIFVEAQMEQTERIPVLLRLSYQDSLVWSTVQTKADPVSIHVQPDWPEGRYQLSVLPLPGQLIKGALEVELTLGKENESIALETVTVEDTKTGWNVHFSTPREAAGVAQLQCRDPQGLLRAVAGFSYAQHAESVTVEYPRGGRWEQLPSNASFKLVFPNSAIEEVPVALSENQYNTSGELQKPMANGCYVEKSGIRHYWHVRDDHALIWDGAPYIPRGGMFHSDQNYKFSMSYKQRAKYIHEHEEALDAIQAAGFNDLYVNMGVGLFSPVWNTQVLIDEFNERGIHFGYQLTTGAKQAFAYSIYSSETQGLVKGIVTISNTLEFTSPKVYLKSVLLVPEDPHEAAVEVSVDQDLTDGAPVGLEIIQMQVSEITDSSVRLSIPLPEKMTPGNYYVILKEQTTSKRVSNVWETLDETKKDLEWISRIDWGPGLRFFVDPICNETGFNNANEVRRFWSEPFNQEFADWLERYYDNDLFRLKTRWKLSADSISTFQEAAHLIPVRNADEARFSDEVWLVDAVSGKIFRTEGSIGGAWMDYNRAVRELYSYKNDEIAAFIKNMVSVPVVSKRVTAWVALEMINRVPGGVDGLGLELYPGREGEEGNSMAYGAVNGKAEVDASAQTMWFIATELGYNARPGTIVGGWPSKENLRRHIREVTSLGAQGFFFFGWKLPVPVWKNEQLYDKPHVLKWISEIFSELEQDKPPVWKQSGVVFPEGGNWWQRSGGRLWNRYTSVYDHVPSGFPSPVCLLKEDELQLWAANSRVLLPVEPVLMSVQDAVYVDYYEDDLNRVMNEGRRVIYCGSWPDTEKSPSIGRHFSREISSLSDGSTIQPLKVFPGDQVLAKEGGNVWAKQSGNLLIISRSPVIGERRGVFQYPSFMDPKWAQEFLGDCMEISK